MDLSSLRQEARFRLKDEAQPYFWADDWLDDKINEAEREACLRARLIKDGSSLVASLDLVAGQKRYEIDPRIIDVLSCEPESSPGVSFLGWTLSESELVLDSAPAADGTLLMDIVRYPLGEMTEDGDCPEIRASHHLKLIDWVEHCAYSVKDAETFAPGESDRALARFEQSFGPRPSASVQVKQRQKTGRVVRMNPF